MGRYLDRTSKGQHTSPDSPGAEGSELVVASPVAGRIKVALGYMTSIAAGAKSQHATGVKFVSKLASVALDDFAEVPPEIAAFYLSQLSLMVEWCATGEWKSDSIPKPDGFGG